MAGAAALAHAYPDVLIILNHAGMPVDRDEEGLRLWRRGMQQLATADNVVVKISGLGTVDPKWTVESIRPFVLQTIEAFGVARSMFASNFPVDKLSATLTPSTRPFMKSPPALAPRNVECCFTITPHVTTGSWMFLSQP